MGTDSWRTPPLDLTLTREAVHVWRATLDVPAGVRRRLHRTLDAAERDRAGRFRFAPDRQRFVVARGVLRALLARYRGGDPARIRFQYGAHGKPALAPEDGADALRFNLSHAGGLALYAITREREIGIDLECLRSDLEIESLAARFFSAHELATFQAVPAPLRRAAFFDGWVRKEAYVKARGEGLALPADQFDVALAPGAPAALLHVRGDAEEAARWSIRALDPGPGYAAAVAAEGHAWRLACWQWTP